MPTSERYKEALDLARFGDWEASAVLLRTLIAETPNDCGLCLALTCVLPNTEAEEEATVFYEQAVSLSSSKAKMLSDQGNIFLETGQYTQAVSAYQKALTTLSELTEADTAATYIKLGDAARKIGDLDEAVRAYREASHLVPKNTKVLHGIGRALREVADRGKSQYLYRKSADIFRQVIVLEPQNGWAYAELGVFLCRQKEWMPAVEALRMAVRLCPDDTTVKFGLGAALGNAAYETKDNSLYREVVETYQQILLKEPNNGNAYQALAVAYTSLGEFALAIAAYREVIRCQPKNRSAQIGLGLGEALRQTGDLTGAIQIFEQMTLDYPEDAEVFVSLGYAYNASSNAAGAEKALIRAVQIQSDNTNALLVLGTVLAKQEKYQEAADYMQMAISVNPNIALAHWWLAFALHRLECPKEAETACQKSLELDPKLSHYASALV